MKHKLHDVFLFLNLCFIVVGVVIAIYWKFIDGRLINPVIRMDVDTQNFETNTAVYKVGDEVSIKMAYCKFRDIPAHTQWKIVDTIELSFPAETRNRPTGCVGQDGNYFITIAKIPSTISAGTWHLEGDIYWEVNPLFTMRDHFKTRPFYVIK